MIFTDGIHLISDQSIDELHCFAQGMGLKRHWFQNKRGRPRPHYDLTTENAVNRAIRKGAVGLSQTDLVRILIDTYEVNP